MNSEILDVGDITSSSEKAQVWVVLLQYHLMYAVETWLHYNLLDFQLNLNFHYLLFMNWLHHCFLPRYENLILVAGGIGISPFLVILSDILHRIRDRKPCLPRNLLIVWAASRGFTIQVSLAILGFLMDALWSYLLSGEVVK